MSNDRIHYYLYDRKYSTVIKFGKKQGCIYLIKNTVEEQYCEILL